MFFSEEDRLSAEEKSSPEPQESSASEASSEPEPEPKAENPASESAPEEFFRIYDLSEETVINVPYADYVKGAVAAEMGAETEPEALAAQACAAFSCALYQKNNHAEADYDFTADPQNRDMYITKEQAQEIFGSEFEERWTLISEAAERGMGYIITYRGAPAMTVYHAISAGKTESAANVWGGEIPYLVPVESAADKDSPNFLSTVSVSKAKALELLNTNGAALSGGAPKSWFEGAVLTDSGYVDEIQIGKATFSGAKLRELFGLRSACFTVKYESGEFIFTVKGYGHGVGMSQVGALSMAQSGTSFEEILVHYYPNTLLIPCS